MQNNYTVRSVAFKRVIAECHIYCWHKLHHTSNVSFLLCTYFALHYQYGTFTVDRVSTVLLLFNFLAGFWHATLTVPVSSDLNILYLTTL